MSSSTIYVGGSPCELAIPQDGIVFQLTFKSAFTVPTYTDTIYDPLINSFSSYQIYQYNTPIITFDTQRGNVLNLQTNGPYLYFNNVTTSTSYTFMMWIYITGYGGSSSIFAANNNTFGFLIYNSGGSGGTNYIQILHYINSVYQVPTPIGFNIWTHFAISFNGNTNTLYYYINGIFVSPAVTGITGLGSATGTVYIGTNSTYGSQIGNYDNIRLYNRVLSADEIWLIYSIENYSTQGITNNFQGNLYYASVFNRVLTSYEISTYNAIINPQNNINAAIGYSYVPPSPLITLSANTIYPINYTNVSGANLFIDKLSTSSIFLNGTSQTISFPSQTITWTNGFSVLFQFQYNTPSSTMSLLSITNTNVYSTSVGFNISITSGNVIQFNIMNPANTSTIICSTTLTQNKIYNIAFIYNNSITTAILYIDGVLIQTTTSITQISSLTSGAYQYIYTGGVNSTLNYFKGVIYYLSFYNTSLSTAQISNFYPISYNNLLTTVSVNMNTDLTTQPFSGYPVLAITPSGLYPQLTNNSMFYPIVDNINTLSYQFTASKSQYYQFQPITLTLSNGITLITQFSWTNTNTQTSTLCTFAQTNSTTPTNYISLQQTGYSNLSLIFNNSTQQYINVATISSGTNYNFAATFNGSTSTIYLNGSNINAISISQIPANASSGIIYNYPYIGCFTSGSNYPTSYFTGNINYLALYNRLLTSTEINNFNTSILNYTQISPQIPLKTSYFYQAITNAPLYLYFDADTLNTYDGLTAGQYIKTWTNLGSEGGTALNAVAGNNALFVTNNLVGYWDFSTIYTTTILSDLSGNNYTATITQGSGTGYTSSGGAIYYITATNTVFTVPNFIPNISNFTVETFIYFTVVNQNFFYISLTPTYTFQVFYSSSSTIYVQTLNNGSGQGILQTTNTYSLNTWYHIVFTNNSIYVNGTIQALQTYTPIASVPSAPSLGTLYLANTSANTAGFAGRVVMYRIYNIQLTSSQIQQNYAAVYYKLSGNPYTLSVLPPASTINTTQLTTIQLSQYRSQNNNRYYVQIPVNNYFTIPTLTLNLVNTGATFIFVASMPQSSTLQRFLDFSSAYGTYTNDIIICNASTNRLGIAIPLNSPTNTASVLNIDNTLRIYAIRLTQNGTIQYFYNNGTNAGTQLIDTFNYAVQPLTTYTSCFISRSNNPADVGASLILGELLVYRSALSDASINAIIATMQNRWNLDSASQNTVNTQTGINFNPKTSLAATTTCALWLDAADMTTVINYISSAETISQWTDKSANAYALTANAYTNAPYYKINALNNKPGIVFSGGQALGNTSVGSWSFSSNHTIFIVLSNIQGGSLFAKLTSNAVPTVYSAIGHRMYWLGDGLQGNGGFSGLYPTFVGGSQGWCSTSQSLLSYGVNSNGFVLCIKLVSLYSFAFYTNGIQMQLVNNGLNESSDTTGQFWIGNSVTGLGPINYLNGTIHEIIAYNTSLGDNDRILVNNYLMNKWGIVPTATPQIANNGVLSTSSLYNFPTMPFQIQNTGIYGSLGPTTSNLLSAYGTATNYTIGTLGSPPLSFTLNTNYLQSVNGIQSLVAPVSGMYQFIVAGASGGYVSTTNAGKGIIIIGNYYVYQGQTLEVLVGQPGKSSYQNASGLGSSGGGGTYLSLNGNLLFVAGGGGGTGWTGTTEIANPSANATLTPYGNVSSNAIPTTITGYIGGLQGYGGIGQNSSSFSYVTANLVGYWDFSTSSSYSGSGTTVNDLSGYGNTITISGTPSFNSTGAISFNPSSTSYGSSGAVALNLVSGFTLESFVYFTSISNTPVTISYALAAGSSYVLQVITTSGSFQSIGAGSYNGNFSTATGAILLGQWYHLVSVYTNLTYTTCVNYINGVVQANASGTNYTAFPNNPASTQIYLGSDPWITGQYTNGKIAMARIYNSPLTAGQVAQNYQALCFKFSGNPYGLPLSYYAGAGGGYYGSGSGSNYGLSYIAGGTGGGGNITYITAGLVAYWDFSTTASYPGSGTNLYDLSGNNFNLPLTNLGTFTSTGQINAAWTTTTYGATTLTTFAAAISFEMLFYLTTTSGNQWLISCGPGNNYGGTGNWSALVSGGTLQFYAGTGSGPNSSGVIFSSSISAATWYHIIFTCTSTSGILYLNGVAQTNGTYNQSTFPLTNTVFQLGNWQSTNGLSGKLAMARIYNIPLTASQVLLNYAAVYNKLQVNPYNLSASPSFIGAYGGGFGGGGLSSISAPGASAPVSAGGGGGGYSGGAAGVLSSIGCTGAGGGSYDINGFNNVATIYTGAIPYNYPYSNSLFQNTVLITATLAPNFITVSSTVNIFVGQTIVTSGTTFGSIATTTTYYIYSIINYNTVIFSAAATPALSSYLTVTTATGTMYGALTPFTTGANVGYNLGAGFVYINIINSSASQLTNYQLQTIQNASLKQEIFYPLDALNQYSRAAACGVYSLRLLSSGYTGPIVQLRRYTDNQILDFYGNYGGVLTSLNGQTIQSWAAGTIAYVVKWYDQSGCANHANQYSSNVQPILNYISGQVDFKFSRYLNLPNGTVPAVNSQYTVVLRHNTVGYGIPTTGNVAGFLNSGTQTITTNTGVANTMSSFTMTTTGLYSDNWGVSLQSASGWYSSNNTVSYVYNLANRYIYVNGISAVTPLASSSHASTTANNAIGATGGNYLNGELYNLSIFNISLLDAERNLIERMPYGNILSSYSADPYFNDVTLLLHCDSVNEYTSSTLNANLVDSSVYKQKVTNLNITGNMRANATYNNFIGSGNSIYFDGTPTNYINIINDTAYGTQNVLLLTSLSLTGIGFSNVTVSWTYTSPYISTISASLVVSLNSTGTPASASSTVTTLGASGSSYIFSTLLSGTFYYAVLSATSATYGNSILAAAFTTLALGTLGQPTAASANYNSVNVNWSYGGGYPSGTSATIYISTTTSTANQVASQAITLGQGQPVGISGLSSGTSYYIIVSVPAGIYGPLTNGVSASTFATFITGQISSISASAISAIKGAYSLRYLLSTYTGPVVQLSNGTTTMNGYADSSGILWTSSTLSGQTLQSWLGASTGYIKTLYDQSGNGSHVTQATQANCPTINFSVSPPTMTFTSANSQYLKVTPGLLNGQSTYTYFAIWNAATAGAFNVCDENVNGGGANVTNVRASLIVGSTTYGFCGESNDNTSIAPYSINTRINTIMRVNNGTNPNIKIRSNGTDYTGATGNPGALSVSNGAFGIGLKLSLTNEFFNGTISHVVVFSTNLSDADTTILATL